MSSANRLSSVDAAPDDLTLVTISGIKSHGVNFIPSSSGFGALVGGWDRSSHYRFGPVQMHGGVHLGDILSGVNDIQVEWIPFLEVMSIVNDQNIPRRVLKFSSKYHSYRIK